MSAHNLQATSAEHSRSEITNPSAHPHIGSEKAFASSSSPLSRTLTSGPLNEKPLSSFVSSKIENDKTFNTPSEYIDWDMMLTPASPRLQESDPQTIPVFRQSRTAVTTTINVPGYGADLTYERKLIRNHRWGHHQPLCCSAESQLLEPLETTSRLTGKTEGSLQRFRDEASPLGGVRAPADSPFAYFDVNLASPTFRDLTTATDAWKPRGKGHSRQASASLSGPQLANLGPLYFTSPSSPLLVTERTAGPLQYSWDDYGHAPQRSMTPIPSFGSPTHASVTCSTLCMVTRPHRPLTSPCVPPALAKDSTFAPPYRHWDDIGYLSLGDRHGGGSDYLQRLEALMSSPMGGAVDSEYAPLTSPTSDPSLPHVYHSAYSNPMFLLSGAEFLLAPKEAPLAPLQIPPTTVEMDASQASSAAVSSKTQPATITLDLTGYGSSEVQQRQPVAKVPTVVSRDYLSNESVEGGHTDASSQRSASTPSSMSGATATAVDSYQASI